MICCTVAHRKCVGLFSSRLFSEAMSECLPGHWMDEFRMIVEAVGIVIVMIRVEDSEGV